MTDVIILCGKTAAGKTTYAKQLREKEGAVLLSVDEVMLKVSDACEGREAHLELARRVNEYLMGFSLPLIGQGLRCVFDYGYWTYEERRRICTFFAEKQIPYTLVCVEADERTRLARLQKRNADNARKEGRQYIITEEMLRRFDGWFEPVEPEENAVFLTL